MRNFLKVYTRKSSLIIIAIILVALSIRFYNFETRINFWSEQARSLIVAADYLKKPSLLGQEYFRIDSSGHKLFASAAFTYSLVPLLLTFKYEPVPITGYFAILNILTGLVLYFVTLTLFKKKEVAIFSLAVFLFNDYMIFHSMFIWILNYLPLMGVLLIYLFFKFSKSRGLKYVFWLGVVSGFSFGLEYFFLFTGIVAFVYILVRAKKKFLTAALFFLGAILGDLPMIIFDLKHDYYHLRTLFQFFIDTLHGTSGGSITYYHFLHFWPLFAIVLGYLLYLIYQKNKVLAIFILAVYIVVNLSSRLVSFDSAVGMPNGIRISDIDKASKEIAIDAAGNFNVAEVLDFDKRAYVLRYFVEYKYGKSPLGVEAYPHSNTLYVLASKEFDFVGSDIWEIKSTGLRASLKLADVGRDYGLFKLFNKLK